MKELVITKEMVERIDELKSFNLINIDDEVLLEEFKKNTANGDWRPTWADLSYLIDKGHRYLYYFAGIPYTTAEHLNHEAYEKIRNAINKVRNVVKHLYLRQKLNCIETYPLESLHNINTKNPNWVMMKEVVEELQNNSLGIYHTLCSNYVIYEVNTDTLIKLIDKLTDYILSPNCSSQIFCLRKEMIKLLNRRLRKGE